MQTHTAQTHHRVDLVQALATLLDFLNGNSEFLCKLSLLLRSLRDEFVQRRVKQAEYHRLAVHNPEGVLYGSLDERFELVESRSALLVAAAHNHLAELCERGLAVLSVEHVLDTEQTYAFRTELKGACSILRSIGIGTDSETAIPVNNAHELDEERVFACVHSLDAGSINVTLGTVEREPVTLLIYSRIRTE